MLGMKMLRYAKNAPGRVRGLAQMRSAICSALVRNLVSSLAPFDVGALKCPRVRCGSNGRFDGMAIQSFVSKSCIFMRLSCLSIAGTGWPLGRNVNLKT